MKISQKRAPSGLADVHGLGRAIQDIYDILNEIIDAVNSGDTKRVTSEADGKAGDVRLVWDDTDKEYKLESKSKEGWVQTVTGTMVKKGK